MKTMLKILVIVTMPLFVLTADLPFLLVNLVPDAHAILGVRRRAVRRGVVIGAAAAESTATANTNAAAATTAQQQSAAAQQAVPAPSQPGATLPLGIVVHTLPANCPAKTIGEVEYHYCGGNYYRTAFQGSNLVYVTANP